MNKHLTTWIAALILIVLLGYGIFLRLDNQKQSQETSSRMQVAASFYPLAHIAEIVGKGNGDVVNLTPAGSEPHDFDPSVQDIVKLQNSKVFIYNGAGLESWASHVIPELEQKGVRVVEATEGIDLLASAAHEEEHEGEEPEEGGLDPHVWLDPVLMKAQVNTISSAFVVADPAHATAYMENARVYTQELENLHQEFIKGLAQCKRRDIVTSHAAFAYLAKRYNLNMIPISGLSPEEEPVPSRLAEISKFVQEKNITHIFFETLVSPKLAETIANETGAQTISFNPLEGLTDEEIQQGKTYISVQKENLKALQVALGCL